MIIPPLLFAGVNCATVVVGVVPLFLYLYLSPSKLCKCSSFQEEEENDLIYFFPRLMSLAISSSLLGAAPTRERERERERRERERDGPTEKSCLSRATCVCVKPPLRSLFFIVRVHYT